MAAMHCESRSCCGVNLIFGAIASAMRPGRLMVAAFSLAILVGGGMLWDTCAGPLQGDAGPGAFESATVHVQHALAGVQSSVLDLSPRGVADGLIALTWGTPASLWAAGGQWFVIVWGLFALLVLTLSLGLQSRYEALVVAQCQPPSMDRLTSEVSTLGPAFVGSWLAPLAIAGVLAGIILLGSAVLLNIPVLNILGGVAWGAVLLAALCLALVLLGLAWAGALLVPIIAVDGAAGPDAMHRAATAATTHPFRWVLCIALIGFGLGIGLWLLDLLLAMTAWLAVSIGDAWVLNDAFTVGTDPSASTDAGWITRLTGDILAFWLGLLQWIFAGWVLCYIAAATTRAWIVMRRAVDGTDMHDIWTPDRMRGTLAPLASAPSDDA